MTPKEMRKEKIRLLRKCHLQPKTTAIKFMALSRKCIKEAKESISFIDSNDCINFAAYGLFNSGYLAEAEEMEQTLINRLRLEIRGGEFSLANSTGRAALACFKLNRISSAKSLARESLRLFAKFPKQSYLVDEMRAELKKHR